MKKMLYLAVAMLLCGACAPVATAAPTKAQTIQKNMKQRQGAVNALLAKGSVGEANTGFLAPRGALSEAEQKLVDAENQDRKTVYEAIAKQQKVTAAQVGSRRAIKIAELAKSGTWLQDADGNWSRKK